MKISGIPGHWRWAASSILIVPIAGYMAAGIAERRALSVLREQVSTDVQLRAALLDSELARFRLLPLALADDRDVIDAIGGAASARDALNLKLEALAHETGAAVIYAVEPDGRAIASSNWRSPDSFVGNDYRFRPYFREAKERGAGSQYAMGTVSHRPGLFLARRTADAGVIVVKLEFDHLERQWMRAEGTTLVRDPSGVVLVTSQPDWRFKASRPLRPADQTRFHQETRTPPGSLSPLPVAPVGDSDLFVGDGMRMLGRDVAVSQAGWRLTLLQPVDAAVSAARRIAALIAALVATTLLALGWVLVQRVTNTRQRTAELEAMVAQRTADLRREMDERAESEVRAAELREALRQANRLASLGQITASVAHETAQPVAAIRTYAQTSGMLLDRGALEEVRNNLGNIALLADRIGTVTAQLRSFSRRQTGALRPVPLIEVIEGALLILKEQLRAARLVLPMIDPDLTVVGGKVRLEQVLVNLIQNALEAMVESQVRHIRLELVIEAEHVRLTVTDTGPGVTPEIAAQLFTPFVTSRTSGLGLGLVIAQDIMSELGGWLHLVPSDTGACFEMGMRRA